MGLFNKSVSTPAPKAPEVLDNVNKKVIDDGPEGTPLEPAHIVVKLLVEYKLAGFSDFQPLTRLQPQS